MSRLQTVGEPSTWVPFPREIEQPMLDALSALAELAEAMQRPRPAGFGLAEADIPEALGWLAARVGITALDAAGYPPGQEGPPPPDPLHAQAETAVERLVSEGLISRAEAAPHVADLVKAHQSKRWTPPVEILANDLRRALGRRRSASGLDATPDPVAGLDATPGPVAGLEGKRAADLLAAVREQQLLTAPVFCKLSDEDVRKAIENADLAAEDADRIAADYAAAERVPWPRGRVFDPFEEREAELVARAIQELEELDPFHMTEAKQAALEVEIAVAIKQGKRGVEELRRRLEARRLPDDGVMYR